MKLGWITLCSLLFLSSLFGEIKEIRSFREISSQIDKNTLLLLDIDNTLIHPVQELGTDQWFHSRINHYRSRGYSYGDALELALPEWEAVQNISVMRLVEPDWDLFVEKLQGNPHIQVMGMTTRGLSLATRTIHQLCTLGIDLSKHAPTKEEMPFYNANKVILYRKGIFFTSGTHKGKALKQFLEKINFMPSKVVFVNDKRGHLRQVEETMEKENIPFVGLRYGYLDQKVKNFREDIANIQFESFKKILSDVDAERILISQGGLSSNSSEFAKS